MRSFFSRGQVSIELITTTVFVLLVFVLISMLALEKSSFANNLKLYLDAKSVAESFAGNINTISEQSLGYYRYVSLPKALFGGAEYNLSSSGNFISIGYEGSEWVTQVMTSNVTIFCFDNGLNFMNRVENTGSAVVVTCHRPNLVFKENSFRASSERAGENATISLVVEDRSHVPASSFVVQFNKSLNYSVSYLPPEEKARISYDIVVPSAGTHNLVFEIDPDNQVNESIEEDNQLNISWQTF